MEEDKEHKEEKEKPEVKSVKVKMDNKNKEAFNIFLKEGNNAFVKHVFKDVDGRQLSYAEMRMIYG